MDKVIFEVVETGVAAESAQGVVANLNDAELFLVGGGCAESTPY